MTPITAMLVVPSPAPPESTGLAEWKLTSHGPPLEPLVKLLPCQICPAPPIVVR